MKRRPLRAAGGFGVYALCICVSTLALQALTSPSPAPASSFLAGLNPMDSFRWTTAAAAVPDPPELAAADLRITNLSVHRVRYVDEGTTTSSTEVDRSAATKPASGVRAALADLFAAASARPHTAEVSSVVVTWEDHPLAAVARTQDARLDEDEEADPATAHVDELGSSYKYELQIWVTGWGLDALWHPANRRVVTRDPFLVLVDLPLEHELRFRVRVKARQTKRSLLGFLVPLGFFATETEGPWSDEATLSPSRDDALAAIGVFLASNKPFFLLLSGCIGAGSLVVAQLFVRRRLALSRQKKQLKAKAPLQSPSAVSSQPSKKLQELESEVRDLRQELADSEDEVRQLMLFSGYGIEALSPRKLQQLERELKSTLRRVQQLKKHGPSMDNSVKAAAAAGEDEGHAESGRALLKHKHRTKRRAESLPMSPIYEHRSF
ncbi:hypothetical protein BBJ28_00000691 [Nothophytophthora sp. Chile5]|nr:hypothetical protein BBJ28_00000691 [Nothophytophthora sp. Chile5]